MNADGNSDPSLNSTTRAIQSAIRAGDRAELNRLIAIYRPYLCAIAANAIPDSVRARLDSSDLVQEALLKGTAQLKHFQGTSDAEFAAWLKQILQNLIVDRIRHHTALKRDARRETISPENSPASGETPSRLLRGREEYERVSQAMQQLTDDQRIAIELRSQGYGFEEVGQRTGRSADAARMLWGRAITRLMKLLESHERRPG